MINTQDSNLKEITTVMTTEEKPHSPEETFLSNSFIHHQKKSNFCKQCFLKIFCCCFPNEKALEKDFAEKEIINENPIKASKPLHHHLVKSSVDLKEDAKFDKTYSDESNAEGSSLNKITEEKTNSDQNFKVSPLPLFLKKNSKKMEKRKSSFEEHIKDYPLNNLFFLYHANRTNFLLAKITQKYITITEKEKSGSSNPLPSTSIKSETSNVKNKDKACHISRYYDNPKNLQNTSRKGQKNHTFI